MYDNKKNDQIFCKKGKVSESNESKSLNLFISNYIKILASNITLIHKLLTKSSNVYIPCPNIFISLIQSKTMNSIIQPFINDYIESIKSKTQFTIPTPPITLKDIYTFINTLIRYLTKSIDNFDKFIGYNSEIKSDLKACLISESIK